MKRTVHEATKYAVVTLKVGGPRSYTLPGIAAFAAGKPRTVAKLDQIQTCLNVSKFRVEEFDDKGTKVADTEAELSAPASKPRSVHKASDLSPQSKRAKSESSKPAKSADEKLEDSEILADVFGGDDGKWDPSMSRARLLSILSAKQGQPASKTMSKAEIITALELIDSPAQEAQEADEN